jgi:hypothetical protein
VEVLDEIVKYMRGTARVSNKVKVRKVDEDEEWVLLLSLSPMQWL